MINNTPNHRYFYLTGYFKPTLNERASPVMPPTNFDCDLCSSIDDKFRDSANLVNVMINNTPNHRYFYLTGYFKPTLNERASPVMPPTNFDCDLCSSIDDQFRDSANLVIRLMPYEK